MSDLILLKVQQYLTELSNNEGSAPNPQTILDFVSYTKEAVSRQLSPVKEREFRIRMSNIGRPGCVLDAERRKVRRNPASYSDKFRNLYGDLTEAAAVAIMKTANVNIISEQQSVKLEIAGITIDGTYDLVIAESDAKIYDVKSASNFAFANIYKDANLKSLWDKGDNFGYIPQLYLYSEASGYPVGGLIIINKEDGQWLIVPPPHDDLNLKEQALARVRNNIYRLLRDSEFVKDFEPVEETYRKQKTGNEILPFVCSLCSYNKFCWPDAKYIPSVVSKGLNPKLLYYTKIDNKYLNNETE